METHDCPGDMKAIARVILVGQADFGPKPPRANGSATAEERFHPVARARGGCARRFHILGSLAVVQWIEQGPPKTQMQVRFLPAGRLRRHDIRLLWIAPPCHRLGSTSAHAPAALAQRADVR
jgi:hypothetical protein